jgi:hypothetical protein
MVDVRGRDGESAEQHLYAAVTRWKPGKTYGLADMIRAAGEVLTDGLDSPTLRELASASVNDPSEAIRELVSKSLNELNIPQPGTVPPGFVLAAGGKTVLRRATDSLHLEVAPTPRGGFQLRVHIDDVEITSAGAGLGMDPQDILIPTNRLVATTQSHIVPIARCLACGFYDCWGTDVTISRDGDVVHWEWSRDAPMNRGASLDAARYDSEVARVAADLSWETPVRTAGRLVLTNVDHDHLLGHGLRPAWVSTYQSELFEVTLEINDDYQIFVKIPWLGRSPEELASAVCAALAHPPSKWQATWHSIKGWVTEPPKIAGPSWQHEQI